MTSSINSQPSGGFLFFSRLLYAMAAARCRRAAPVQQRQVVGAINMTPRQALTMLLRLGQSALMSG